MKPFSGIRAFGHSGIRAFRHSGIWAFGKFVDGMEEWG